ncbi:ammonium permease [Saccharomycopsis crataegensis]|uniref:Ammonium transporter n=1 Tax=Saccharomycopsis crataegensis TaxID=43959 RepID=A0AAV5QHX9_9ASCO|nr:ammonium permease [Saccharomycopsis crataegensis]
MSLLRGQISHAILAKREDSPLWTAKYDLGITGFIITASAMLILMITGLGLLYSGLVRRKNGLSLFFICIASSFVVTFQWYFWGYSLAFSSTATNGFIGNLDSFGFKNLFEARTENAEYPELLFAIFEGFFAAVACVITVGAIAERGRIFPSLIFSFVWATVVYCPIACWVWNTNGWAYKYNVLDYAGGGAVEIASGFSGFAYSIVLKSRDFTEPVQNFRPHNNSLIALSGMLLWCSWCFFNAGTALAPNMRAIVALINTNLSGVVGALTWCFLDWRIERKFSLIGLTSGLICGLVAATPSSAFIPPWASVIQGIVSAVVCNFATGLKYLIGVDDALDILAEHGLAGVIGLLFNAIFAADYIITLDGVTEHGGGWITHNYKQLYIQVAFICAAAGYSFVVSLIICYVIDIIPGCKLRASKDGEMTGMDEDQLGEFAYDYVEIRREFYDWNNTLGGSSPAPEPETVPEPKDGDLTNAGTSIDEREKSSQGESSVDKEKQGPVAQ